MTRGAVGDVDVLESVLGKDAALIREVRPDQWTGPTPCPDYDVRALVDHIVGWLQVFGAAATGRTVDGDPATFTSSDPVGEFRAAAAEVVAGWRSGGVDRTVRLAGPDLPGQMVLAMTLMEYVTHGCDLAAATSQAVPFSDAELELALERARATLPDQYRGEGQAFGLALDVPEGAPVLERLLGFMGRRA
ncbi:MAG: TIGR03086 family metal-binding protein [Acidimicrobiales bacterium]